MIYPGSGNFTDCVNQNPAPGRFMVTNNFDGSGTYTPCYRDAGGEMYDATEPKFFFNHPNLHWVPTNGKNASKISGIIPVGKYDKSLNFYVGRINITFDNMTFPQIGKVLFNKIWYYVPGAPQETYSIGNIDVLACTTCPSGTVNPNGPCCLNGGSGPCMMIFIFNCRVF